MMIRLFIALGLSLIATAVAGQDLLPDMVVRTITTEVIDVIKQDQGRHVGDEKSVVEMVEAKVRPHFDFNRMTALAMGSNWPNASADQQTALINQFRSLLVRSYSSAVSTYRNRVIEFKPLRAAAEDTKVTVRTQFKQPGFEPINIDYSLEKTANGWKVYEIVAGGVNLITNYRETFNAEIRSGGVDGLINSLSSKNRSLETQATSKSK